MSESREGGRRLGGYNPAEIEPRWQARWTQTRIYEVDLAAAPRPYYNLMMFPYPSAEGLHVGNVYAFTGSDIHGRFMAMRGSDVFEPMGFDAFGIHSENFAIKLGVHPRILTARNVERFRETQLKRIGARFDWSHQVETTDPHYYKWTQWIFVQLYKGGLAVRKKAPVDWCPSCKTVLADEQVIAGQCERCGTPVVQRDLEQWFLRITKYAPKLLADLDWIDWSEVVKTAQRNWIGRSEGLEFRIPVDGVPGVEIPAYTTRPDTVFGMTYVVLAPEHPLVEKVTTYEEKAAVDRYREQARSLSELERLAGEREKTGAFTGCFAVNPANGERVPIWIADYVLMTYGTGAIMAVPAHDQRDFEFARKFGLEIREVIIPTSQAGEWTQGDVDRVPGRPALTEAYTGPGIMVNSGQFTGLSSEEGGQRISDWFEERGIGKRAVHYRIRDWLISRQRYWGPPIPIVYCARCGIVPVPEDQLPVLLPDVEDFMPTGTGSSPLARVPSFVEATCPTCGGPARRETDVSDNFLDSAWYFVRYPSAHRSDVALDPELTRKWLPVDMYIGGAEHSVLHLLYSRFITMALHDLGYLDFDEPFEKFRAHGLITKDGAKMSKSRGNVVNPDEYIDRYGADTLRMYLMFLGPYDQGGDFSDQGIGGVSRFLHRLWGLIAGGELATREAPLEARRVLHRTIKRVTEDLESLKYNTAIAALMEYQNFLQRQPAVHREEAEKLLLMLAPLAPFIAEELWERIGKPYSIHQRAWPGYEPELAAPEKLAIPVQVNGRTRDVVQVAPDAGEEEVKALALGSQKVQRHLGGRPIKRTIYVPGRLLNLLV